MKLRPRQEQMIDFIQDFQDEHGYPPTIREIGAAVGISSTSVVNYNLEKLEEQGRIERNREVSRGLRLVQDGSRPAGRREAGRMRSLPLYGAIAAGNPIPIPDDPEAVMEMVTIPTELTPRSGEAFALRVKGHSMIDALVDDGDLIVVHSQARVETGQMAVVEVLEPAELAGATLKRFYHHGDTVELRPANPDPIYRPFVLHPSQVKVHGSVVGVLRRYE